MGRSRNSAELPEFEHIEDHLVQVERLPTTDAWLSRCTCGWEGGINDKTRCISEGQAHLGDVSG